MRARWLVVPWFLLCGATCGAPERPLRHLAVSEAIERRDVSAALGAYERARGTDGDDAALLTRIAEILLEDEAQGDDAERRQLALHELELAGTAGHPVLERVAEGGSLRALVVLAEAGNEAAERSLRERIGADDPETRAAAVLGLRVELDHDRLLALATDSSTRVRAAAVARLGELAPDSLAREALEERTRSDPDPSVRAEALRALGAFGASAIELLRERLLDPIVSVRTAAIAGLLRADRGSARPAFAAILAAAPSAPGIEVVRLLGTSADHVHPSDDDASAALAYLTAALRADDVSLRTQAAAALSRVWAPAQVRAALTEALGRETDPSVRLALARSLLPFPNGERDALAAIVAMAAGELTPISLEATILLAAHGDTSAVDRVEQATHARDVSLRRVAARALGADAHMPARALRALSDPDAQVRIYAASGILAASAAQP